MKLYVLGTENLHIDAASSSNETTIHRHCKLLKYASLPLWAHYFEAKIGGRWRLLNHSIGFVHTCMSHPTQFLVVLCTRLRTTTTAAPSKSDSLAECVLRENSSTCAHTKPHVSSYCEQQKSWWWPVNMAIVHVTLCSRVYEH